MRRIWTTAILIGVTILSSGSSYANEEINPTLPGGATMDMVWIEPGTFQMGTDVEEGRGGAEGPQHQVTISNGFYLGKYELTQGQWAAVMGSSPWAGQTFVQENPDSPAVYISWDTAQIFVQTLNKQAGASLYRLPTEAEWEYACRAGNATAWSFGDDASQVGEYAWFMDNTLNANEGYAHQVGAKKPNPWGLYDMHGNAFEWVQDSYLAYPSSAQTDPVTDTGGRPGRRGGGFDSIASSTRSASRGYQVGPRIDTGMRLVRVGPVVPTAVGSQSWGQVKQDSR